MNPAEIQELIKDQIQKRLGFSSEPRSADDIWKYNKRFLEVILDGIQLAVDKFNKGCVVELRYDYLEEVQTAKLVGVEVKGQLQFDYLIKEFEVDPKFWKGEKEDE